jgi:hypothetical protein
VRSNLIYNNNTTACYFKCSTKTTVAILLTSMPMAGLAQHLYTCFVTDRIGLLIVGFVILPIVVLALCGVATWIGRRYIP